MKPDAHRAGLTDPHTRWIRALIGSYLVVHFLQLLPWAGEVFSGDGMLEAAANPFFGFVPNPLFLRHSAAIAHGLLGAGIAAGTCLALGKRDRIAAALAWLVWMWLYTRNPFIANPSIPFVGWMLLAHAALGRVALGPAWIIMAVAYSYSGVTKLASPSWLDGSALSAVLHNPLARPTALRDAVLALPAPLMTAASFGVLGLEVLFAPLSLSARLRPRLWMAMVGMHLGIVALVDFADLTCGMLLVHAYTFDPGWLPALRRVAPTGGDHRSSAQREPAPACTAAGAG